jgi:predicted transport protein
MILYTNDVANLRELKEKSFKLEKEIQNIFEKNLLTITGLSLIKSEFTIKSFRIDTLAFDAENKSFIIIEYKRDRNYSVIDQGVSYLNLMLEYKADFIVEYNESLQKSLKREEVDWSQSKVIFVSSSFTDFQKQSTNFKDLSIELWEIKQYENDIILINPIKKSVAAPSIKPIAKQNEHLEKVAKEIKTFTEEEHTNKASEDIRELYNQFKIAILNLNPDIEIQPKKDYIAFKKGSNVVDITVQKKSLKIWINMKKGKLDDPKNLMRDVFGIGHWGNGDYELVVEDDQNLEYIMSLVKQVIT